MGRASPWLGWGVPSEDAEFSAAHRAQTLTALPLDALVTTREAAALCGFRTPSALRKAHLEGRIHPVGRRGGRGTQVWLVADLQRFMRGLPPLPREPAAP